MRYLLFVFGFLGGSCDSNFSDLVQFNHDISSHAYIRHLLSRESLKISHHAKCYWSNFRHERDGKAPC